QVADSYRATIARPGEVPAVGTERNFTMAFLGLLRQGKSLLAGCQVPDPDGLIDGGRGQVPLVGAEGQPSDPLSDPLCRCPKGVDFPAGRRIPDLHGTIRALPGEALAVRTEGDIIAEKLTGNGEQVLARLHVPHLQGLITAHGGQTPAVRAEGHAPDVLTA